MNATHTVLRSLARTPISLCGHEDGAPVTPQRWRRRAARDSTDGYTTADAGDIEAGALLEFDVAALDVTYTATIAQVADRMNDLRDPLTGHELTVEQEVQ